MDVKNQFVSVFPKESANQSNPLSQVKENKLGLRLSQPLDHGINYNDLIQKLQGQLPAASGWGGEFKALVERFLFRHIDSRRNDYYRDLNEFLEICKKSPKKSYNEAYRILGKYNSNNFSFALAFFNELGHFGLESQATILKSIPPTLLTSMLDKLGDGYQKEFNALIESRKELREQINRDLGYIKTTSQKGIEEGIKLPLDELLEDELILKNNAVFFYNMSLQVVNSLRSDALARLHQAKDNASRGNNLGVPEAVEKAIESWTQADQVQNPGSIRNSEERAAFELFKFVKETSGIARLDFINGMSLEQLEFLKAIAVGNQIIVNEIDGAIFTKRVNKAEAGLIEEVNKNSPEKIKEVVDEVTESLRQIYDIFKGIIKETKNEWVQGRLANFVGKLSRPGQFMFTQGMSAKQLEAMQEEMSAKQLEAMQEEMSGRRENNKLLLPIGEHLAAKHKWDEGVKQLHKALEGEVPVEVIRFQYLDENKNMVNGKKTKTNIEKAVGSFAAFCGIEKYLIYGVEINDKKSLGSKHVLDFFRNFSREELNNYLKIMHADERAYLRKIAASERSKSISLGFESIDLLHAIDNIPE